MNTQIVKSGLARKAIVAGRKNHMRFKEVKHFEIPEGWVGEAFNAESTIPPEGLPAIQVLEKAGMPIKGMILLHEAPKLLPAPKEEEKASNVGTDNKQALETVVAVLIVVATVIGYVLIMALRTVAFIDPKLIVVLEDGTHLEVATWYDFTSP